MPIEESKSFYNYFQHFINEFTKQRKEKEDDYLTDVRQSEGRIDIEFKSRSVWEDWYFRTHVSSDGSCTFQNVTLDGSVTATEAIRRADNYSDRAVTNQLNEMERLNRERHFREGPDAYSLRQIEDHNRSTQDYTQDHYE